MGKNPFLFDSDMSTQKTVNSSNPFLFDEPSQTSITTDVVDTTEGPKDGYYPGKAFFQSMDDWGTQSFTPFVNELTAKKERIPLTPEQRKALALGGQYPGADKDYTMAALKGASALIKFPFAVMGGALNEIPVVNQVTNAMFEIPANTIYSSIESIKNPEANFGNFLAGRKSSPGQAIQALTGKTEEEQMKDPALYSANQMLELGASLPGMALFHKATGGIGKTVDFTKGTIKRARDIRAQKQMEQVQKEQASFNNPNAMMPDLTLDPMNPNISERGFSLAPDPESLRRSIDSIPENPDTLLNEGTILDPRAQGEPVDFPVGSFTSVPVPEGMVINIPFPQALRDMKQRARMEEYGRLGEQAFADTARERSLQTEPPPAPERNPGYLDKEEVYQDQINKWNESINANPKMDEALNNWIEQLRAEAELKRQSELPFSKEPLPDLSGIEETNFSPFNERYLKDVAAQAYIDAVKKNAMPPAPNMTGIEETNFGKQKEVSPEPQVQQPVESSATPEVTPEVKNRKPKRLVVSKETKKEIYGRAEGKTDATSIQAAIDNGSIPKKLLKYAKELIRRLNEPGSKTSGPATFSMFGGAEANRFWEKIEPDVARVINKGVGEARKLPSKIKNTIHNLTKFAELEENNVSGTSRPQVPAMVNDPKFLKELEPGDTVYDIGGGKYDLATEVLNKEVLPQFGGGGVLMIDPLRAAKFLTSEAGKGVKWLKEKGKVGWADTKEFMKDIGTAAHAEWQASKANGIGPTPAHKLEWVRETTSNIVTNVFAAARKSIKESKMTEEVIDESLTTMKVLEAELKNKISNFNFNQGIKSVTGFIEHTPFSPRMGMDIVKRFIDPSKFDGKQKAAFNAIEEAIKTVENFEKLSSQWIQRDHKIVQKVFKDSKGNFKYTEETENNVWEAMKDADRGGWTWDELHNDPRIRGDASSAKLAKELENLQSIFDKKIARMSELTGKKIEKKPGVYVHRIIESGKNIYAINPAGKQKIASIIKKGDNTEISDRYRQASTNLLYDELFGISENRLFDDSWSGQKDVMDKIRNKLGDMGNKSMFEYYSERQPILRALKRMLRKDKEWKQFDKLNNSDMTKILEDRFGKGTVSKFERAMKLRDIWSDHMVEITKKIETTSDASQVKALKARKAESIKNIKGSYDPDKIIVEIKKFDTAFDPSTIDSIPVWKSVFKERLRTEPGGNPVLNKFDIPNQWKTFSGKFLNFKHAKTLRDAMAQYVVDINQGMGNTEMLTKLSKLKTEHAEFNEVSKFINKLGRYVSGQERFMAPGSEKTAKFINAWQANSKMLYRPSFHFMQLTQPIENIKYFGTSEIAGLNIPGLSDAVRLASGSYRTAKGLARAAQQSGGMSKIDAVSKLLSNPKMEDMYKIAEATGQFSNQTITSYDIGFGGKAEAATRSISEKRVKGSKDIAKEAWNSPQKLAMANDNMARLVTNNTYLEMYPKEFENMKKAMKLTNDFTEMDKLEGSKELKDSFDRYMQIIDKVNVNYGRSGHAMALYHPLLNMAFGAFKKYDYHKFGEGIEMVSDVLSKALGRKIKGFNDNEIVRGNMMGAGLLAQMALGGWRSTRLKQLMAGYLTAKGIQTLVQAMREKDEKEKKRLQHEATKMFQSEMFEDDSWAKLIEEQPDETRKAFFNAFWNGIPNWVTAGNVDISTRVKPNLTPASPQTEGAINIIKGLNYVKGETTSESEKSMQAFIKGFLTPLYGTDVYGGATLLKFDALSKNPNDMTDKEKAELKVLNDALVALGNTHESYFNEFGPFDYKEKAPAREITPGEVMSKFLGFNSQKARDEYASMYIDMQKTKLNKKEGDDLKKKFSRDLLGMDVKEQKIEFKKNEEEISSFREKTGKGIGFEGTRNLAVSGSDPVESYVRDMERNKLDSETGSDILRNSIESGKYRKLMEILDKRIEEHDNIQNRRLRRKMLNLKKEYKNLTR